MKNSITQSTLAVFCLLALSPSWAGVTTYSQVSEYCFPQTSVRGGYNNLVIDHNLIVPSADFLQTADIYVSARLKDAPDTMWLLANNTWREIVESNDTLDAQYMSYAQLPAVVPVSVFQQPADLSAIASRIEILVGYGLRAADESTQASFDEMLLNRRYNSIWESPNNRQYPELGLNADVNICLKTAEVDQIYISFRPSLGEIGDTIALDPTQVLE
jgi:hypothetical protein